MEASSDHGEGCIKNKSGRVWTCSLGSAVIVAPLCCGPGRAFHSPVEREGRARRGRRPIGQDAQGGVCGTGAHSTMEAGFATDSGCLVSNLLLLSGIVDPNPGQFSEGGLNGRNG